MKLLLKLTPVWGYFLNIPKLEFAFAYLGTTLQLSLPSVLFPIHRPLSNKFLIPLSIVVIQSDQSLEVNRLSYLLYEDESTQSPIKSRGKGIQSIQSFFAEK